MPPVQKFTPGRAIRRPTGNARRPAVALLMLFALAVCARAEELPDPKKPGPHPVGVTTTVFVDHGRTDTMTKGPRSLLTEIWYPATEDSRALPKNRFSDFFLGGAQPDFIKKVTDFFKVSVDELDKRYKNNAIRDARVAGGKFPLVVFSHGNGGIRSQNAFWCEHLASHGYIVFSPDHTGNCTGTVVDGKTYMFNPTGMINSAKDRPKDVSFLIDCAGRWARGEDSRFNQRINMDIIGVAGHSFGGFTSAAIIDEDPRVRAIIPMTPVWRTRRNFTTPFLLFLGTEDKTIGIEGNATARKRYDESKGPHYSVEIVNGGHFTFTEMFQIDPNFGDGIGTGKRITIKDEPVTFLPMEESYEITNAYSIAFLGVYLKGQEGYREFLDANHYGDKIIHKADRGDPNVTPYVAAPIKPLTMPQIP